MSNENTLRVELTKAIKAMNRMALYRREMCQEVENYETHRADQIHANNRCEDLTLLNEMLRKQLQQAARQIYDLESEVEKLKAENADLEFSITASFEEASCEGGD